MVGSNYPRSYGPVQFTPDRVWGTVFIVLYALMLAATLLIVFGGVALMSMASKDVDAPHYFPVFGAAFATALTVVLTVAMGVHIAAAAGIRQSKAWGFWATIALSILTLAGSGGATCLTLVPLVYSILRLSAAYGPKPV